MSSDAHEMICKICHDFCVPLWDIYLHMLTLLGHSSGENRRLEPQEIIFVVLSQEMPQVFLTVIAEGGP